MHVPRRRLDDAATVIWQASPRLSAQVEAVLGAIDTLPFDSLADEIYGSIRTQLEMGCTPIGGNDLLIGAIFLAPTQQA
jgi:tRNA(fMet)-specific endonuclease VapC